MNSNMGTNYPQRQDELGNSPPQIRPLSKDEVELWNSCLRNGFFTFALPTGVILHFIREYKIKKNPIVSAYTTPRTLRGKFIAFASNCFFAFLFYSPVCYGKLKERVIENEKKSQAMGDDNIPPFGGTQPETGSYESNIDSEFGGPQGGYSHLNLDINSPIVENMLIQDQNLDVVENKVKPPETTYEELRQRNRSSYRRTVSPPTRQSNQGLQELSTNRPPQENFPPPRPKNKYGDDME